MRIIYLRLINAYGSYPRVFGSTSAVSISTLSCLNVAGSLFTLRKMVAFPINRKLS